MKNRSLIIILLILPLCLLKGQQLNKDNFNQFVNKFTDVSFPLEPEQFFVLLSNLKTKHINRVEYDTYLRTKDDSFWEFNNDYEYCFGGKKKFDNYWLIFYSRHYLPEEINETIGEIVLETMTFDGKLISRILVNGGYGDTRDYTFQSKIYSPDKIELIYTKYIDVKLIKETNTYESKETKYTKYYYIQKDGKIVLIL
ncbi:hypothetical protein [Bacteroides sedimenti]|uniref:GLPGLI family protein n=1 Tax=Bacteroides sedimenti TaxID=2136147 RepID=A0ABM8ICB2_9BACE